MDIIKVKVIPNAKKSCVIKEGEKLKIYVKSPPAGGKANKELIEVLSDFLKVKKKNIRIIKGEKSREKVIEVKDEN
ncbi:MAG: hypothetical protein DRP67_02455 [Candidatus Omnitrophota bacterium]|nr:MAG: hypothetical protein DRP67_02455 [Candidatus Omnitrophota bacterium]